MKKLFTKLLAGIMAVGCVCAMASCAPKLDMDMVEDALEDNGYEVVIKEDKEATFMGVSGVIERSLTATSSETGDSFTMYEAKDEEAAKLYYDMMKKEIKNEIAECKDDIALCKHMLNKYDDLLFNEDIIDCEDEIKELKEEIKELKEELKCIGVNGVYVWHASSEDALKDAQG
ncbi:MAG: hypothetical protein J6S04_00830 [Clostridia bacterium]|nr:hypothetical protein [Clostridia bacterium]